MECDSNNRKMVATLLSRKDALEAKLGEKTLELKKLCIQEAELTGILPPETPIEPDESPPIFRRRVSTAFTYPANLISKLKSKEEEALTKLEIECKVQTSIAEAALALANDLNAGKSIRRKHRLEYQQSQRRLAELEARLNVLRQSIRSGSQIKQRKKLRPPFNIESDCIDGPELAPDDLSGHYNHMFDKPSTLPSISRDAIRNSHFYNSFGKASHTHGHLPPRSYQPMSTNQWNRNQQYRRSVERSHHNSVSYDENTNWLEDASSWRNTAPPVDYFSNQCYTALTFPSEPTRGAKSRYGSLDRRYRNSYHAIGDTRYSGGSLSRASPTLSNPHVYPDVRNGHSPNCIPLSQDCGVPNAVLLPNQTYPENSLMRTQSLGNVEPSKKALDTHSLQEKGQENFHCSTLGRRSREKGWQETALDTECYERRIETPPLRQKRIQTPPLHPRASKMADTCVPQRPISMRETRTPPPPSLPPPHCPVARSPPLSTVVNRSPVKSPVLVAETVPLESPKNHTVVEVGKWQPYREVTKPFEMSDFYKYSTKFRKSGDQAANKDEKNASYNVGGGKTQLESLQENMRVTSNEDINKNNVNEVPYLNPELMKNITHRRYRPLMAVNDRNENIVEQWCNEA